MRVLLISASPINKTTSIGNTFLNIMPKNIELSSLYTRGGLPDESVKNAFCITEKMLLKFGKGKVVKDRYSLLSDSRDCFPEFARKHRFSLFFIIRELIWRIFNWKTSALNDFINDINPDVIFTVSSNAIYLNRIISYIADYTDKPLMVYAWDNNYFDNPFEKHPVKRWLHKKEKLYMKKVIDKSEKLFVISPMQKDDYDREFSVNSIVLTKYDDFSSDYECIETKNEAQIELVYTGNLGVNRWKTLALLVGELKKINKSEVNAVLRIYSGTPLTEDMKNALDDGKNSFLMGSVPAQKIPEIQKNADILVHAEGFDEKSAFRIKYSFSTKIVDYLKAARPILAIGPRGVASIEYFLSNDSAVVCDNPNEISERLTELIENEEIRKLYSKKAYECGKANHDKQKIEKDFYKTLSGMEE